MTLSYAESYVECGRNLASLGISVVFQVCLKVAKVLKRMRSSECKASIYLFIYSPFSALKVSFDYFTVNLYLCAKTGSSLQ